ncbi:hypothetical protein AS9A_P20080 (plasmid) [Hoyosella subflava DQS3-9A1]|uniref:Uncharacterized protein n=1 Tax=Hoyosella subflava (strain DSM 45089 / JCM 17490 / NBRC 109087 / DQS3-9A1) TaxID=443218 RepID=F6ESK4_HOYSD|nr:hypothetical protein AS9A_P20080 [Hoyosella subflava DQS3-9A1]
MLPETVIDAERGVGRLDVAAVRAPPPAEYLDACDPRGMVCLACVHGPE